eukprot:980929-Karenia_brevis.AAC.1
MEHRCIVYQESALVHSKWFNTFFTGVATYERGILSVSRALRRYGIYLDHKPQVTCVCIYVAYMNELKFQIWIRDGQADE